MGRPPKYSSEKERANARREQNRLNVRAYRQRSKSSVHEKTPSLQSSGSSPDSADSDELLKAASRESQANSHGQIISVYQQTAQEVVPSLSPVDAAHRSFTAPIELSFGLLQAVADYFYNASGCVPWLDAIQELRTDDRVVDMAILSVGSRWLGHAQNDDRMTSFARQAHRKTTQRLQSHLENVDTRKAYLLNTMNAALLAFETSNDSSNDAFDKEQVRAIWISHFAQGMTVMKQAGPLVFQSPLGLEILRGFRPRIMFAATFQRQSSFLDDDRWRTIPYLTTKISKRDELWQLAERIPRFLQRVDALKLESDEFDRSAQLPQARRLWADLVALRHGFQDWLVNYAAENAMETKEALWWSQTASAHIIPGSIHTFPTVLYFRSHKVSDIVVNYWDALLQLLCASFDVQAYLIDIGYSDIVNSARLLEGDLLIVAQSICKSMECVFGPDERDFRGILNSGLLPLRSAWQYFVSSPKQYYKELQWCATITLEVERRGIGGGWLEQLFNHKTTQWDMKNPPSIQSGQAVNGSTWPNPYNRVKTIGWGFHGAFGSGIVGHRSL